VANLPEFLFTFQGVFELVQGLFELNLNFVKVVNLVFGSLQFLASLLVCLSLQLLLLVEFVDELVLVGDLVVEVADLVVLGGLVLFGLLEVQFEVFDILLQP